MNTPQNQSSATRRIALNTAVQVIGRIVSTILAFIVIAALTRHLGIRGYGDFTTIFVFIGFFALLTDSGIYIVLVRLLSIKEAEAREYLANTMALRVVLGLIVYLIAVVIAHFLPQYSQVVKVGIILAAVGQFWLTLNQTVVGVFQSRLRMDQAVLTDVAGRVVILGLVLYLINRGGTLLSVVGAYAVGNFVNFILSLILANRFLPLGLKFNFARWREIFLQSLPVGIVLILGFIYFRVDTILLSLLKSNFDVGIYGAPYKVLDILLIFPAMFLGSVFPIMSKYLATGDTRFQPLLQKSFDFMAFAAVPVVLGLQVLAPQIMQLLSSQNPSSNFVTASSVTIAGTPITPVIVLQILALTVFFSYLGFVFSYTITAMGQQRRLIVPAIIYTLFNLTLNLIFIPKVSYFAAAVITVLTEILVMSFPIYIIYRLCQFRPQLRVLGKAILSGVLMAVAVWLAGQISIWLAIIAGGAVYLGVMYAIGGIPRDIWQILVSKSAKT